MANVLTLRVSCVVHVLCVCLQLVPELQEDLGLTIQQLQRIFVSFGQCSTSQQSLIELRNEVSTTCLHPGWGDVMDGSNCAWRWPATVACAGAVEH